jgi:F0F1-type ATP synthase alpha subunit
MNFLKFFTSSNVTKDVEGFEKLQKRINDKSNFLESAFHSFSDLNKSLKDFLKQVISYNTKFTSILKSPEEQPLHETCKLIYQKLINDLEQDSLVIDEFKTNLNNLLTQFNKEKNVYENLKKINKDLEDEKIKLIKNRDTYFKVARDAEKKN